MLFSERLKGFQAAHPCQSITVGGAQYRYVLAGNEGAQTLVLLNGGMNTLAMWTTLPAFSACCFLIIRRSCAPIRR